VKKEDFKGSRREIKEKASEKALQFFYEKLIYEDFMAKKGRKG
jgi:hypothetical protein